MTHAYDENLLHKSRKHLGIMLHMVVYDLDMEVSDFYPLFLKSNYAKAIGEGSIYVILGSSAYETVFKVMEDSGQGIERFQPIYPHTYTHEYWVGWALAYYQWYSNRTFAEIDKIVPIEKIQLMYYPFHEMDVLQFCEEMERRMS